MSKNNVLTRLLFSIVALIAAFSGAWAQGQAHVSFEGKVAPGEVRAGESTQIIVTAKMVEGWHIFGNVLSGDWINTAITVADGAGTIEANGDTVEPAAKLVMVPGFEMPGAWWEGEVAFAVPVKVLEGATSGTVMLNAFSQACDDTTCDMPTNFEIPVEITITPGPPRPDKVDPVLVQAEQPAGYIAPDEAFSSLNPDALAKAQDGSLFTGTMGSGADAASQDGTVVQINEAKEAGLLPFFLLSVGAGLLALLTPCVWPMIPITVSYFSKKSEEGGKKNLTHAIAYSLGIILTFCGLGLAMTAITGSADPQVFASNIYVNLFLAGLFVFLAMNLFGYFEIGMPQKFVNSMNKKAGSATGLIAPILLGFVFSLTTFTCTVPFVGTILFSATQGDYFYPLVGMLGFSLAFALPFFGLAMAPRMISKLPKSGGWLNSVKAYLGFIELAAGLKFLSNAELVMNGRMLTFPVYMAIWAIIFSVAALYLFGLLKIPNQSTPIGLPRKIFAVFNVGLAGFLLYSINHSSLLGSALAFTPPDPYPGMQSANPELPWHFKIEEAREAAQASGKPIFVNFTGVTCGNCRVMEKRFKAMPEYNERLGDFTLAELYTDRGTPEDNANARLREEWTKSVTNPVYVIMSPSGEIVSVFQGLALEHEDFYKFLDDGLAKAGVAASNDQGFDDL